jgi:hypothetical protein
MRSSRHLSLPVPSPSNPPNPSDPPTAERSAVFTVVDQIRRRGIGGVPVLKLRGDWLASVGFPTGTYAVLQAANGRIVIEARGHLSEPGAFAKRRLLRTSLRGS